MTLYYQILFLLAVLATPFIAVAADTQELGENTKGMSCTECINAGLGAKEGGCSMCIQPFLGIPDKDSSCEKWTENRRAGGKVADEYVYWFFGFVSGYNEYGPGTPSNPKHLFFHYDETNLLKVIDRNCSKLPKMPITKVITAFLKDRRLPSEGSK